MSTTSDTPERRPARPACCQVLAILPEYPVIMQTSSEPMSIPSSSALVLTTAIISPLRSPRSIARALAKLQREAVVTKRGGYFYVLDMPRLLEAAGQKPSESPAVANLE